MNRSVLLAAVLSLMVATVSQAQGGRGRGAAPPQTAKEMAPIDVTGYWVSVITEDWHVRMLTAQKGDFGSGVNTEHLPFGGGGTIPYNAEGRRVGLAWDPDKDQAEGNQCKGYGAAGVMRLPGRLHITWEDDYTLRMDTDAGTQTRRFHFRRPPPAGAAPTAAPPQSGELTLQGHSDAEWIVVGGQGWPRGGNLKVVTTRLRPGYYWKNGMPYSDKLVLTEHHRIAKEPNGDVWLNFSQLAEDPQYLTEPWVVTYHFKRETDGSKFKPVPCSAK